jgi:pimeloyl-ACP methyl ester carboxylesterase
MDAVPLMNAASLRGITVHYLEVAGASPPIVFLHGVTDSLESYRAPMAMLAGEYRMLAMDFRGHGLSDHTPGGYRIRDYAEDVQAFVQRIVGEPVVIAGHSLGGLVAACTGALALDLVCGVFLEDPPLYTGQMPALSDSPYYHFFIGLREVLRQHRDAARSVDALASIVGTWPIHPMLFEGRSLLEIAGPEAVGARAASLHRMDLGVLEPVVDGTQFEGFDPDEALAAIRSPVHLLAGDVAFGGTVEQRDVERLASVVRCFTRRMLPGVGHFIHHTAPIEYVHELRAFARACG